MRGLLVAWLLGLTASSYHLRVLASPGDATAASVPSPPMLSSCPLGPGNHPWGRSPVARSTLVSRLSTAIRPTAPAETLWFRLRVPASFSPAGRPDQHTGSDRPRRLVRAHRRLCRGHRRWTSRCRHATDLREFGGAHDSVFILPDGAMAGQPLYLRVATQADGADSLRFSLGTLDTTLARATAHSRMIALAVGALTAMALGSLLSGSS